ncbi:MAG: hypothetical protein ABIK65_07575 [Candidatus Eisenbacteria bacterium]
MKRTPLLPRLLFVLLAGAGTAAAEGDPRVLSVTPAAREGDLVCRVETEGLPTEKAARSMGGGLPSAVDVVIELVDEEGEIAIRSRITIRVSFDLWEEIYRVEGGAAARSMKEMDEVRAHLADLRSLPVAPLASLAGGRRYRIRVGLVSHAIAPAEKTRFGDWIAGDGAGTGSDAEGREVTFGLGNLIRFVFGGSAGGEPPAGIGESVWFRPSELPAEGAPDA